ncbi:MAG: NfeD family protein [Candidatus Aminicenantes bacterium]|jgi:membrane-bound serine protease (ClpP class)
MPLFLKIVIAVVALYLLFEFIEHFIIPLAVLVFRGKRKQVTGPSSLIGEVGEVREWSGSGGRIFVHGSLWAANSDDYLNPGDKVEIVGVDGLVLRIKLHAG